MSEAAAVKVKVQSLNSSEIRMCLRQPQSRWKFKVWTTLKFGDLWGSLFWCNIWRQLEVELPKSSNIWVVIHSSEVQPSLRKFSGLRFVAAPWFGSCSGVAAIRVFFCDTKFLCFYLCFWVKDWTKAIGVEDKFQSQASLRQPGWTFCWKYGGLRLRFLMIFADHKR